MNIQAQLAKIAAKRKKDAEEVFKVSVIRLGNRIIQASPFDKGTFKNRWNTSIGSVSYDISAPDDKSGQDAINELNEAVGGANIGVAAYFNNPMPYGPRLEYDGWSEQALNGFLRINTDKWESIVNEEVKRRQ